MRFNAPLQHRFMKEKEPAGIRYVHVQLLHEEYLRGLSNHLLYILATGILELLAFAKQRAELFKCSVWAIRTRGAFANPVSRRRHRQEELRVRSHQLQELVTSWMPLKKGVFPKQARHSYRA
jgi:hypothetical protein